MLVPFNRQRLRNGEVISFYTRVLDIVPATGLPAAVLSARGVLNTIVNDMSGAHVGISGSVLTQDAQELDAARDDQFAALVLQCRAQAYHKDAPRRAAAQLLLTRTGDYGTVAEFTQQGASAESADITSLLRDIRESQALSD